MMSMDEMMKECRRHCQETARSVDQTMKMMEEAEQSNDPARMRDALGQARKSLAEMKNHIEAALTATLLLRGFTLWAPMAPGLWLARRELSPKAPAGAEFK